MPYIDYYLQFMIDNKASDVHLSSNAPAIYRIDGEIIFTESEPLTSDQIQQMAWEIMPERNQTQFMECNDTDLAYSILSGDRFRVNVFRDLNGVGIVIRLIPSKILTFEDLRLPPVVRDFCTMNKGLVLVTGPTGSGKSTTLAAMVDYINRTRTDHIITIEDPIEFVHKSQKCLVNHREVGRHTNSFSAALRAALREDPDIVLVGEMRDLETVEIAIETAETGHLVFGTLHTTTAASTVDRIIQQFPANRQEQIRAMLSTSLKGVVAQTLLRKKQGGRVAALEIMVVNSAISALIRENKVYQIPSTMQTGHKLGMKTLNAALLDLVKSGLVNVEDAVQKSIDRADLKVLFDQNDIPYEGNILED
ncbi:MAG: type IV pilus twitching motility protein PilT [Victivallaceae bacterium]|nr:type IV pilus twitching motility protein PilT [Victivallaceae bacterium]